MTHKLPAAVLAVYSHDTWQRKLLAPAKELREAIERRADQHHIRVEFLTSDLEVLRFLAAHIGPLNDTASTWIRGMEQKDEAHVLIFYKDVKVIYAEMCTPFFESDAVYPPTHERIPLAIMADSFVSVAELRKLAHDH